MRTLALISSVRIALAICSMSVLVTPPVPAAGSAFAGSDVATGARNERSTPRNSILPFSPAIAPRGPEQVPPPPAALAKAILVRLGYDVGRLDDRTTARFKAAIFQFQRARGLAGSGDLDSATLDALGLPHR